MCIRDRCDSATPSRDRREGSAGACPWLLLSNARLRLQQKALALANAQLLDSSFLPLLPPST
eukprot:2216917-Pleurochrysis_carterae.AAC.1